MQPRFQLERGGRKLNLVVVTNKDLIMLNAQIRPTLFYVAWIHKIRKRSRNTASYIFLDAVRDWYDPNIAIGVVALTYNWQGAVAQ